MKVCRCRSGSANFSIRCTTPIYLQSADPPVISGSFSTYGYLKDHHKLIIDEEIAPVVRMVFDKFISGMSIMGIAKELNAMGISNPSTYKRLKGFNYHHPAGEKTMGCGRTVL